MYDTPEYKVTVFVALCTNFLSVQCQVLLNYVQHSQIYSESFCWFVSSIYSKKKSFYAQHSNIYLVTDFVALCT